MEAILLAGGKAERLGDAAGGRPKALVEIAGRPLAAYRVALLATAGVVRVIVSCATGQEQLFEDELSGLGRRSSQFPRASRSGVADTTNHRGLTPQLEDVVPLEDRYGRADK